MYEGERFNSFSHLFGLILAVLGTAWLLGEVINTGNDACVVGAAIFGLTLVLLYLASTLYHSSLGPIKTRWQRLDHCSIYLLIAGTATPFIVSSRMDWMSWLSISGLWTLAALGVGLELRSKKGAVPSVWLYIGLGWLAVFSVFLEWEVLGNRSFVLLLSGAVLYTVGTLFYRVSSRVKHAHGVWHLFVLMGTTSHFFSVAAHIL